MGFFYGSTVSTSKLRVEGLGLGVQCLRGMEESIPLVAPQY